jgi:hypothetical protein
MSGVTGRVVPTGTWTVGVRQLGGGWGKTCVSSLSVTMLEGLVCFSARSQMMRMHLALKHNHYARSSLWNAL